MATVGYRVPTEVYLQCPVWTCEGNEQVKAEGWFEDHSRSRRELGAANESGTDRSTVVFGTDEDITCPSCGRDRDVVSEERPVYARQVQDPQGLGQDFLKALKDGRLKPQSADDNGELADLRRELAELKGFVAGKAARGRPAREVD